MDMEELKKHVLSIEKVLDFAFEGIMVCDKCGKVLAINKRAKELLEIIEVQEDFDVKEGVLKYVKTIDPNLNLCDMLKNVETFKEEIWEILKPSGFSKIVKARIVRLNSTGFAFFIEEYTPHFRKYDDIRELEKLALLDLLTGLGNRRYLELKLKEAVAEKDIFGVEGAFVFIDVDHFKEINDKYGHLVGDEVLVRLARILTNTFLSHDFVGRWGGDEFGVVLNNVSIENLPKILERLFSSIRSEMIKIDNGYIGFSISAGVTAILDGDTTESVIKRADEELYNAKRKGGNNYSIFKI